MSPSYHVNFGLANNAGSINRDTGTISGIFGVTTICGCSKTAFQLYANHTFNDCVCMSHNNKICKEYSLFSWVHSHSDYVSNDDQPYPLLSYFIVVVCLKIFLHHILSLIAYTFRENRDFVFIIIVQLMISSNSRMRFGLQIALVCLYIISFSSLCKFIGRHRTYKMPVRYILSSVWVTLSIFSQLSIIQYMGLCVFSLPISLVMIERVYTLSYYHHQIGSMNYHHCFGSRNDDMRCMLFYILILMETFSAFLALCEGNPSVTGEFPS